MSFRKLTFISLALLVLAFCTLPLMAQTLTTGDIYGTVTDKTGAVVPNATVTIKSLDTGETLNTTSTLSGGYHVALLKPGNYSVTAKGAGMESSARNVAVLVGQVTTANVQLGVQGKQETVEVTAEAPLLQTENANVSTTFNTRQITDLPSPGGDITNVAQTAPGVVMNAGVGFGYGNFNAYGLPATSNLFTENGNDLNDPFLNLNNSGSSNLLLGQNELQEATVVENGYTGQYGRQAGVQVDYTTKSGTNTWHGNAQYQFNSTGMNANEWFNKQAQVLTGTGCPSPTATSCNKAPSATNNAWADSIGGPIVKDKLFFFVDNEGLRYVLPGATGSTTIPTPGFETFVLNNIAATQPAQLPFYTNMFKLYNGAPGAASAIPIANSNSCGTLVGTPVANGTTFTGPCAESFFSSTKNLNREWFISGRVDYNVSDKDKLFFRAKFDRGQQPTSSDSINQALFGTHSVQPEDDGQLNWSHVFGQNAVNNFLFNTLYYSAIFVENSGQAAELAAFPISTLEFSNGVPGVSYTPFSNLGGTSTPDFIFPQGRNSEQWGFVDDYSITKGNHTFKIGANYRRNDFSIFDEQVLTGGVGVVGSLSDFANGLMSIANGDIYEQQFTQNPDEPVAYWSLGVYGQDEWRVTSNLKLTMSLRADRNSNPVCQKNCFSSMVSPFESLSHDVNTPYNQAIHTGLHSAFPDVEKLALQPRFGFAWTPFGHSNTVIRGGLGIFSDLYQGVLLDSFLGNSPRTNLFLVFPGVLAPTPLATIPGGMQSVAVQSNAAFQSQFASGGTLSSISAVDPFFPFALPSYTTTSNKVLNPKYAEWDLEVQQQITPKTVFDVKYVGTHGYDVLVPNQGVNAFNSGAAPFGNSGLGFGNLPTAAPDARFSQVTQLNSNGISNFAGLITSITRRFGYGFQGSLNYTYSHALDDVTSLPGTPYNLLQSVTSQINPLSMALNYGNSDSDTRHNVTANYLWELPYKFQNKFVEYALGGWQFGGTVFARSGLPWTAETANSPILNLGGNEPLLAYFTGGSLGSCNTPGDVQPNASGNFNGQLMTFCAVSPATVGTIPGAPSTANFLASGSEPGFGNVARNAFRGPKYFNTDFNVMKNFKVTERVNFALGANMFNVLNHPNFSLPENNISNPLFGTIQHTVATPTTPYGAFQPAGITGRLIQVTSKITF